MKGTSEEIMERIQNMNEVRLNGGNVFQQLEARLTDASSGSLISDIVIYAVRTIRDPSRAEDFLKGYIEDIRANPEKYALEKESPESYAKGDIANVLGLYFRNQGVHDMWYPFLSE